MCPDSEGNMSDPITAAIQAAEAEVGADLTEEVEATETEVEEQEVEEAEVEESAEGDESEEGVEAEEAEGEGEEDGDDEEGEGEEPDSYTVKVDGEELEVSLDELVNGYQRQADYSRKTQELANQRKELEQLEGQFAEWYEARAQNPGAWVHEIIGDDPQAAGDTLVEAIGNHGNPTHVLAQAMVGLARAGRLSDEFVQAFGLEKINGVGRNAQQDSRYDRLAAEVQGLKGNLTAQQEQQQAFQGFKAQWEGVKAEFELTPEDDADEMVELMKFAHSENLVDLRKAYVLREALEGRKPAKKTSSKDRASKVLAKKKATRGVTKRGSGSTTPAPTTPKTVDEALELAEREIKARAAN